MKALLLIVAASGSLLFTSASGFAYDRCTNVLLGCEKPANPNVTPPAAPAAPVVAAVVAPAAPAEVEAPAAFAPETPEGDVD